MYGYDRLVKSLAKMVVRLLLLNSDKKYLIIAFRMYTKNFILKKIVQGLLHLLFWTVVLLFYSIIFKIDNASLNDNLIFSLFIMPITIATTYITSYKLIPEYLIRKKYAQFLLYSTYTFIISFYFILLSIFFRLIYISNFGYTEIQSARQNILFILPAVYLIVSGSSALKLYKINLKQFETSKKLKTKVSETQLQLKEQELNYLKMQIHPHFLFNTLNTIYGFALRKADKTPEMILRLSNLLDYLLYQTEKPFVLLSEEIEHVEDYIELEKVRFNDTLNVQFNYEDSVKSMHIAPMILLPFVENSFKHGVIKNGVLKITIDLVCKLNTIDFMIKNSSSIKLNKNNGIGLQNLQKRLDFLYKNNYNLTIKDKEEYFSVHFILKLN